MIGLLSSTSLLHTSPKFQPNRTRDYLGPPPLPKVFAFWNANRYQHGMQICLVYTSLFFSKIFAFQTKNAKIYTVNAFEESAFPNAITREKKTP